MMEGRIESGLEALGTRYAPDDMHAAETPLKEPAIDAFRRFHADTATFGSRIAIDAAEISKLDGRELYPGMGAEVMIKTGKRTTMDYILAPLTDSLRRAFRED